MLKGMIQKRLEKKVQQYFAAHPEVKLVAVTGTAGKLTTMTTIATVLSGSYRVRMQEKSRATPLEVALDVLGIEQPPSSGLGAWWQVLRAAKQRIKQPTDVDVVLVGIESTAPGQMAQYSAFLRPSVGVVTAVAPEQLGEFGSLERVAEERLALANFSELALINRDDVDGRFASFLTNGSLDTYGTTSAAEYRFETSDVTPEDGYRGTMFAPELPQGVAAHLQVVGEHSLRPVMAAFAVAVKLGMTTENIVAGVQSIRPVPGRMNMLRGLEDSLLIDDTHSSDPASAEAALQTLYSFQAPQRLACLGDMAGLGDASAAEHQALGNLCDPNLLAWVITVGEQAEKYLAPQARARGCQVKSFRTALEAGAFAHKVMERGAIVLAKGSGEGIYLEEALKIVLHDTHEDHELVRQSPEWMAKKAPLFARFQ